MGIVCGHSKDRNSKESWMLIDGRFIQECQTMKFHSFLVLSLLMHFSLSVRLSGCGQGQKFKARCESHTVEAELGMPCRVVPLGVPLMALKICSESERELLAPPSTVEICSCMMCESSLARSL